MNFVDYGPQNSRGFRALKVWLALKHVGAAGYRSMIAEDIRLSQTMAQAVSRHAELQLMTQELSITTFRYVPRNLRARLRESEVELHLDALNRELVDRLQRGGETFVSNAVVDGHYVLRACIVNFHTTQTDEEAVPERLLPINLDVTSLSPKRLPFNMETWSQGGLRYFVIGDASAADIDSLTKLFKTGAS